MQQVWPVLLTLIPVFLIIGIGPLLRATNTLKPETDKGIMTMVVQLLMPCLILNKIIGSPAMKDSSAVGSAIAIGFGLTIICTFVAYYAAGFCGFKKGTGKRTFGVTTGLPNYGYLPIPMIATLFPDDGALSVLFVHNVGVEIAMWTVSVALLSGTLPKEIRHYINGPMLSVALALVINFTGLDQHIPGSIMTTLSMLGNCALPLALILIGASLYDLFGKEKFHWGVCTGGVILRIIAFPALILATAAFLPISTPLKQVLVIQAAMPAAMFPIVLARVYGGQVGLAVQIVLSTTTVSLITMPFVIIYAIKWLNI